VPPNRTAGSHLLLAVLALPACLAACSSDLSSEPPAPKTRPPSPSKVVRVTHPEPLQGETDHPSNLYVERDVRLTARRTGVIEQVLVDRGDTVRSGQTLAVLESDTASAELEIARQELLLAQLELDRVQPLYEQKIASTSDYDRAKIARAAAQSRVTLAEAALERCSVRAPFAGQVAERWAVAGMRVEEDDGTPLFRIVARDVLRARVDVPEAELRSLKVGGRATVEIPEDGPVTDFPARIAFISPAIDPASGTASVIVEITASGETLKLGGAVRVRFEGARSNQTALVRLPREALISGAPRAEGEAEVLIVAGGLAAKRRIIIMETRGNSVLVRGPLDPSDQVIVGAGSELIEGDPVEPGEKIP
jgi:membrane fusion protein, multidrug efflux system